MEINEAVGMALEQAPEISAQIVKSGLIEHWAVFGFGLFFAVAFGILSVYSHKKYDGSVCSAWEIGVIVGLIGAPSGLLAAVVAAVTLAQIYVAPKAYVVCHILAAGAR